MKSFIKTSTQAIWKSLFPILVLSLAGFLISSCDTGFRSEPFYSVYGYVTDAESLKPLMDAEILLGNSIVDSTDTSGYYYFVSLGRNKRVKITARAEGYLPSQKEVFVPKKGGSFKVDFALTKE
jgi:hypothetical protein